MTAPRIATASCTLEPPTTSRITHSSADIGWSTTLVQRQRDHVLSGEVMLPAIPDQHIVVLEAGHGHMESRGAHGLQRASYHPGAVAMTAPGMPTDIRWRCQDPFVTVHVYLPGDLMTESMDRLWPRPVDRSCLPDVLATQDALTAQIVHAMIGAVELGLDETYAETAAAFLGAHLVSRNADIPIPPTPRVSDNRIAVAISYIHDNMERDLRLSDLAVMVGLSTFHFARVFRRAVGKTPHQYILGVRIERARRHLERMDSSVSDIAYLCGFASPAHLASTFHRRVGVSPSAYRAEFRTSEKES